MLAAVAIRVTLGEDRYIVREGLRQLLSGAECDDADELLRAVEERRPDVVLTDIRMPPTQTDEGIRVAAHLRTAGSDGRERPFGHRPEDRRSARRR
jgi:CheY-like chemotaxis protein